MEQKPMMFFEIGKGKFAQQVQEAFLKAHQVAFQVGEKVPVLIKIEIDPPDTSNPEFGNLSWEVDLRLPKKRSIKHFTKLSGGLPMSDGTNVADALQVDMFAPVDVTNMKEVPSGE
jgi:hypothetical protein